MLRVAAPLRVRLWCGAPAEPGMPFPYSPLKIFRATGSKLSKGFLYVLP